VIASLALSALSLASATTGEFVLLYAALGTLYLFSGTGLRTAWSGLRPFFVLILFTAMLQVFFTPGTPVPGLEGGRIAVTEEGLRLFARILLRLVAVILVSANLVSTTSPLDLSRSLGWFLLPARRLGLPVNELVLTLNLGFQLFPLLLEESQSLRLALESRGISVRHHRLRLRLRATAAWVLAIFASVMDRTHRLTVALEVKGFGRSDRLRLRFPPRRGENLWILVSLPLVVALWLLLRSS